jgi:hypothetical protein
MFFKGISLRSVYQYLLIAFISLSSFAVLYIFRSVDDNRLTSWKWVFREVDVGRVFLFLVFGLMIAFILSRVSFPEKRPGLFLFLSSFASCMVFWSEPEVIVDASRYFTQAKHLQTYGFSYYFIEWGRGISAWTDLPLVPFLYGLLFKLLGESRVVIQVFTTLLFSLTAVFTYLIGKALWDRNTIPYIYSQVPLFLVDVPTMFFLAFSIFTFIMAIERGRAWITLSAVSIFLTFFSKYSAWIMLSVIGVVFLVYLKHPPNTRRSVLQRCIAVSYVSFILILVLIVLKFDVFYGQISFLREYQVPGLRRWSESFISSFFYQIHPFITTAALVSLFSALKRWDLRYLIIAWMVLLVVLFQIRRARYIMLMFPMLTLMASYGLQIIKTHEIRRFIVFSAVISSVLIAAFVYLPFLQTISVVNLKHAGKYLNSVEGSHIEVMTLASDSTIVNTAVAVPILDLFTKKDISYTYAGEGQPSFEKIKESPLRFTWEYRNPGYYEGNEKAEEGKTLVIISNLDRKALPVSVEKKIKGYNKIMGFDTATGIFRFSPVVSIYQP